MGASAVVFVGLVAVAAAGCGHHRALRLGSPSIRAMRVFVPAAASFVADGGVIPPGLDQRFSDAVQTYLRQAGVAVISQPGVPADAALALEGRLKEVAGMVQGQVSVTIWGGAAVVDQLRWTIFKPSSGFIREDSRQVVSDVLVSPAFAAYSDQRVMAMNNPPPPPPPTTPPPPVERTREQATDEAKTHAKNATAQYSAQQYAAALVEYEAAYADFPDPALLFNIAQCHRKLGHNKEAVDYYRRYLHEEPSSPKKAEIEKHIAELERAR